MSKGGKRGFLKFLANLSTKSNNEVSPVPFRKKEISTGGLQNFTIRSLCAYRQACGVVPPSSLLYALCSMLFLR